MGNKDFPKVSVITVTYNAGGLLPHTMDNVLAQTYANMEYIVIDGASTDGSQDIIRQRSCDRLKWISEKDGGIYDAMNKGVGMASGEWVLFMNVDDTFASNDTLDRISLFALQVEGKVTGQDNAHFRKSLNIFGIEPNHVILPPDKAKPTRGLWQETST